jgi:hypothetical protein
MVLAGKGRAVGEVPNNVGLADAVRFQRDLYLYWRAASGGSGLPLTTRRFVARPALRRVRTALEATPPSGARTPETDGDLAEGEDLRLFFVRRLLERLGLLEATPDAARLVAAERAVMARFLAHPLAERLRICARLWVAGGWWPDRPQATMEPPRLRAPAPPRLALGRRRALEALGACATGERVAIPPAPLAAARATPHKRTARPHETARSTVASTAAPEAESDTLRAALLGPLAWMGFVVREMADGPGVAHACRAGIALGAVRPEADVSALVERYGRVVIQPDLSLMAYPPLTAPLLLTLDTCAESIAHESVARYRLTRSAVARAMRKGWSADEVTRRLEGVTGDALPDNVRVTLADWGRHVERLRLTPEVTLLAARAPAVLDALLADRTARGWVERRLTPTAALLKAGAAAEVRVWLLRHGELPACITSPNVPRA